MIDHHSTDGRVGRHPREVPFEVVADVLEVGEQDVVVPIDRVVADVRRGDRGEDGGPGIGVQAFVRIDVFGLDPDDLAQPPHDQLDPSG